MKDDVRNIDKYFLQHHKMVQTCEKLYGFVHPSDVVTMLRRQGKYQREIAEILGVSISTVRYWMRPEVGGMIIDERFRARCRENVKHWNERRKGLKPIKCSWRGERLFKNSR